MFRHRATDPDFESHEEERTSMTLSQWRDRILIGSVGAMKGINHAR